LLLWALPRLNHQAHNRQTQFQSTLARLNTIHNLYYYQDLMAGMREAIEQGVFAEFKQWFYKMQNA
jgi:queuine tRNA-ribosyltransferase